MVSNCVFWPSPHIRPGPCYDEMQTPFFENRARPWPYTLRVWQDGELQSHESGELTISPYEMLALRADELLLEVNARSDARLYRGNYERHQNIPVTELVAECDIEPRSTLATRRA